MKYLFLALTFFIHLISYSQDITGTELLDNSIKYHDPQGIWKNISMQLSLEQTRPNGEPSLVTIEFSNGGDIFKQIQTIDGKVIQRALNGPECTFSIDNNSELSEEQITKYKLTCDRTKRIRNYYVYLYGLPMKLKDEGTFVNESTRTVNFQGKEYLELKITYDQNVGKDTWYFYINPENFAMEGYRFYHDESKNDGEYITLDDIVEINDMKIPKLRKWYINKDDKFLGADNLLKAVILP